VARARGAKRQLVARLLAHFPLAVCRDVFKGDSPQHVRTNVVAMMAMMITVGAATLKRALIQLGERNRAQVRLIRGLHSRRRRGGSFPA
jgi:hypothetical protein